MPFFDKLKQAANAVWSGPFAIGPLAQPISLGAALLRILEVIWKFSIVALVSGGTVLAAVVVWTAIERKLNPAMESKIDAEVRYDLESCTKDLPILVIVHNGSKQTLASARINLIITQAGRSTNLNMQPSLEWDAIIQPGMFNALCYGMPTSITDDPKTLEYSANIWFVSPLN